MTSAIAQYSAEQFEPLLALSDDEVVTHSFVRDVPLPSGATLALVTLDNGRDHTRPSTLGPRGLLEFAQVMDEQAARGARGEIAAVAVTGKPFILAAGADLSKVESIPDRASGKLMAQLGHYALGKLGELGVPSFVFINGLALGGGVEVALNADYRTIDRNAAGVALPEVFLGIIPGWGGAWLLPNLIGIENALKVVVENPLKNNRMLTAEQAFELGMADAIFDSATFLESSIRWADGVIAGRTKVKRPNQPGKIERAVKWDAAIGIARNMLEKRIGSVARSPYVALDLLKAAKSSDKAAGFAAEDDALADLISGDQFRASIYAFTLVQKRAKKPAGAPDKSLATPVTRIGVLGAGLMASQFALLFVRRLQVPVIITDLDQERVDKGIAYIHGEISALEKKGRLHADDANRLRSLVTGTTDKADFAGCDWVIEAVFEELAIKQAVFAEIEKHVSPTAVLATNTSSLSVEQIASKLEHPERVVGFHFFNPVAVMPLIEVVNAPATNEATLATAMALIVIDPMVAAAADARSSGRSAPQAAFTLMIACIVFAMFVRQIVTVTARLAAAWRLPGNAGFAPSSNVMRDGATGVATPHAEQHQRRRGDAVGHGAAHRDEAEQMPLYRMARLLRGMPMRRFATGLARNVALIRGLPLALRGRALKVWRALVYAEAL